MRRREFLKRTAAALPAIGWATQARSADEPAKPKTYTFKTVGKCDIKADVYRPAGEEAVPVAVWIHGGALIMGDRRGMDGRLRDRLLKAGLAVVSIDYRLAPETKLPAILEDVQDAFKWIRDKGGELFGGDAKRLAVLGGSAGGYLTLCTGYRVEPRPRALVSYWGYGDLIAEWYAKPDPFYRTQPLVSKEDAYLAVGKTELSEPPPKNQRGKFYLYCRQNGLWPKEVAGLDPDKDAKAFAPFCPVRNVTDKYPATLLIHGTKDTDVPYSQSEQMANELEKQRVSSDFFTVKGAGHGLAGAKPEDIVKVHERAVDWVLKWVK